MICNNECVLRIQRNGFLWSIEILNCLSCLLLLRTSVKGKTRSNICYSVPRSIKPLQRRSGTWRTPSSVAHTCLKPSQPWPVLIYRPLKDGGLSKPRPRVQRATGPRSLRDHPRPTGSNRRPSDPKSSTLPTGPSRHGIVP